VWVYAKASALLVVFRLAVTSRMISGNELSGIVYFLGPGYPGPD